MRYLLPIIALPIAAALATGTARAAFNLVRYLQANATSHCQTALPVYDGNVRKRPLAVQNEGSVDAFVTCSFTAQATDLFGVTLAVSSTDPDQQIPVTCTAVTGHRGQANQYSTKTVAALPAPFAGQLIWDHEDFDGSATNPNAIPGSGLFSVSCKLPPDTGIGQSYLTTFEDVGE